MSVDEGGWWMALSAADQAMRELTFYAGVLDDPIGRVYRELVDLLTPASVDPDNVRMNLGEGGERPLPVKTPLSTLYRRLYALLAEEAEFSRELLVGDAWQNHLLTCILRDENAFSRKAESAGYEKVGQTVRAAVEHDLRSLRLLFEFDGEDIRKAVRRRDPDAGYLPVMDGFQQLEEEKRSSRARAEREMKERFCDEADWMALLEPLAGYLHRNGLGVFRGYTAFRWEVKNGTGRLEGIAEPDPIHLDDLFAYERERELLIQNTEQFVAGYPANNVLLYGDRGTGKSSTVKALLHAYADRGLRMVEVQKEHLGDFPQILRLLRGRRERFVLFIDDLSFEEHETHYKDLKALLEGSLEARPANMVLYATSNRRHLVKERHSDRIHKLEDDEIHLNDTSEEKLSLSDRFGLTLTFVAPTQERYLAIVQGMAERRGVTLPPEELRARALAWATQRGGRSGRGARQFMDHLVGELRL